VVLNVRNGDILAMASRPLVNLTNLESSLKDPESPFINRAVTAYPPGSVFKTVLLCAGLDSGLVYEDEYFKDEGFYQLGEIRWNCTTSEGKGHGFLSLTEAFAYSCNPVFIELALRINPGLITDYAEKFGFGKPVNIGLTDAAWGELPTGIGLSLGERANLALGQQVITATPLEVASLIQTIANDGVRMAPRLLLGKCDFQKKLIEFDRFEFKLRVLKEETAKQVQRMMAAVLEYGTGREGQPVCKAAGKTGTVQNSEGRDLPDHAWFAGYAPLREPRYAVVVFCEKGASGGKTAAPIFRKIVDIITIGSD
jgi:cell division protein FtsI/penicillin-binding protein 2